MKWLGAVICACDTRPEGSTVDARDFAKHSSLIRIRTNFIPEIIKSAEDL